MAGELIFGLLAMHGPSFAPFAQAEDAVPAPVDTTPAPPTETPPEVSPETPPDTTTPEQSTPQEEAQPPTSADETPAPNEAAPTQEIIGDENAQESTPSATLLNEAAPETNPVSVPEFTPEETTAINESSSVVSTQIDDQIVQQTQQEEEQLGQTATPEEAAALTLQFADQKVSDIETSIQSDDFASTDFLIQRVTDQLDQALNNIGTLSEDNTGLTQDLRDFSQRADTIFRSVQLVVPENLEQDFEIARGLFLNIEQTK